LLDSGTLLRNLRVLYRRLADLGCLVLLRGPIADTRSILGYIGCGQILLLSDGRRGAWWSKGIFTSKGGAGDVRRDPCGVRISNAIGAGVSRCRVN
jgi:hypothetical protein